ncbi:MAG: hypothetical protein JO360_19140 [Acidobacteria bacterium]|nr:hypothetical protein [Acidobacteriota bacterium]
MKKLCAMLFGLTALLFLSAGSVLACDCKTLTPGESFAEADIVFMGKMVGMEPSAGYAYYKFEVQRTLKGDESQRLVKVRNMTCNLEFFPGATYLIYAQGFGKAFIAAPCSNSMMVAAADAPRPNVRYIPAPDHRRRDFWLATGLFLLLFMLIGFPAVRSRYQAR